MSHKKPDREILSLTKLITGLSYRHANYEVFSDFVEMAAISLSNAVDLGPHREKRELRYLQIFKKYTPEEIAKFPEMLASLTNELELGFADVLGKTYHELKLHNKWAGQYFTPFEVCRMMAKMTVGDVSQLPDCGYLTVMEPAAGSGSMVLAFAEAMKDAGLNYQRNLHVTAVDVDAKCVHMCYIQLSLMHIPAVIVHGNSLTLEEWDRWYTPAHILGLWSHKLRRNRGAELESIGANVPTFQPLSAEPRGQLTLF